MSRRDAISPLGVEQPVVDAAPAAPEVREADIRAIREELATVHGAAYWARLEELVETAPFRAFLERWFPSQLPRLGTELGRRDFLRSMGASLAVAGLGACTRQPDERIVPFATSPEATIPGKPRYFATTLSTGSDVIGVLVESHMGRPTKIEGNPDHPASLGATDALAQATLLGLYDPDRSHSILHAGQIATWDAFLTELSTRLDGMEATRGDGLAVLTCDSTSPTLHAQLGALRARFPAMGIHHFSPIHRDHSRAAARQIFGRDVRPRYAFDKARVVVSLDADFLASGSGGVRYARDFAAARRARTTNGEAADEVAGGSTAMNRLYAVESSVTLTGAMADHRLAVKPSLVEAFTRALANRIGLSVDEPKLSEELRKFASEVAMDLSTNADASIVLAGEWQSTAVHGLVHLINDALHNSGTTIDYVEPASIWGVDDARDVGDVESIDNLVGDIRSGRVATLIVLGGNPVYDAPADLDFAAALRSVPFRAHLSPYVDETSQLCHWHVPEAHSLESWSDARAYDGTASIVQPLIAPLYGGKSAHELVAVLQDDTSATAHELVRAHWQEALGLDDAEFERKWQVALHDGVIDGAGTEVVRVRPLDGLDSGEYVSGTGIEISLRPDASTFDGRFANNGWLQETPRPLSRLTWDNVAMISSATAAANHLSSGDIVEITVSDRRIEAPVWVTSGHADGALTLHLGYGRESAGQLGSGVGFDAYRLRTRYASWRLDDARLRRTGRTASLACVQKHADMEGREPIRVTTFDRFRADPHALTAHDHDVSELSMYEDYEYSGYAWGMVIDLNTCIGCNACMVACQSENNVPIVGKEEVERGRELHWIRIDRYYEPEGNTTRALHQPIPCMHCENAPCEVVCPVGATTHSDEGLNEMVYNRCVGTRYCSNNCPYKVRRFNFFKYSDYETESLKLANNPDVTVRARGVMEKCTYCVQRINQVRITAKKEDRVIQDGEVVSACMQACPTQAIVFGDINDKSSAVSADRAQPHHYGLLEELGTRPRTTYLAKLLNPNPRLESG